jgi:hypothetical protein
MTDILKRLETVVKHAEHGVDPYWVAVAITEIERLRWLIGDFCVADAGDIQCDCTFLECVCEHDAYRAATDALHHAAEAWNTQGDTK